MWCLRNDAEFSDPTESKASSVKDTQEITIVESEEDSRSLSIACDGSVINKYPGFRDRCQGYLNQLTQQTNSSQGPLDPATSPYIRLELAPESAILGAAVAVAVAVEDQKSG